MATAVYGRRGAKRFGNVAISDNWSQNRTAVTDLERIIRRGRVFQTVPLDVRLSCA